MDYLFYSLGTTGDALPFIKLGSALRDKGASATFIGNEKFAPLAKSAGVQFVPVSSRAAYESTYNNPLTWSRNHAQNHYNEFHFPAIKPTFKAIQDVVRVGRRPIIVYQDALSGARMAAEEFGLKSCQVVLAPQGIESKLSPSYPLRRQVEERLWDRIIPQIKEKAKKDTYDRLVRPLINPARKELGLSPWTPRDLPDMQTSPAILALFPDWFKGNPGDWPAQLVSTGFILGNSQEASEAQTNEFIQKHGAPLVFTFGTGIPVTPMLIDKIKHVCRVVGKPGIFVAHSQQPRLIENDEQPVLILSSARFGDLFAKAALVIHHGGVGTCAQALACGVPQVVSPYTFDQPDNAYLLWQLGISNAVDFLNDAVSHIAATVTQLLSSETVSDKVRQYQRLTADATEPSVNFLLSLQ